MPGLFRGQQQFSAESGNVFARANSDSAAAQDDPAGSGSLGATGGVFGGTMSGVSVVVLAASAGEHGLPCTIEACDDLQEDIDDHKETMDAAERAYEDCLNGGPLTVELIESCAPLFVAYATAAADYTDAVGASFDCGRIRANNPPARCLHG